RRPGASAPPTSRGGDWRRLGQRQEPTKAPSQSLPISSPAMARRGQHACHRAAILPEPVGAVKRHPPAGRGPRTPWRAGGSATLSPPRSRRNVPGLSSLARCRHLQIVEPERVLPEDFGLHLPVEVLPLQELVHRVRPLAIPVRIVGGVEDVILADPARHVWNRLLFGLAGEVRTAACHVLARFGLAERRIPRTLL